MHINKRTFCDVEVSRSGAETRQERAIYMTKGNYSFDVLINGSSVKEYSGPNGLTYIEGKKGSEFTLRIQNNSGRRILAVMTVDGLSVIDGKPASFNSQGYILDPWSSIKVPGWRLDDKEVAKFYFDASSDSYAAKIGKGNNVGVIGCAIFEEEYIPMYSLMQQVQKEFDKVIPWPTDFPKITWTDNTYPNSHTYSTSGDTMYLRADNSNMNVTNSVNCLSTSAGYSASSQKEVERGQNIGTGFGRATEHKVTTSSFKRPSSPTLVMEINYDDRDGLKAKGVYLGPVNQVSAFPEEKSYCTPPQNWVK